MIVFGDLALVTEWLVGQGGQGRGRETSRNTAEAESRDPGAGVWNGPEARESAHQDNLRRRGACHAQTC